MLIIFALEVKLTSNSFLLTSVTGKWNPPMAIEWANDGHMTSLTLAESSLSG